MNAELVCEAHPYLEFPHDNCSGPGMPRSTAFAWLDDAVELLAQMAVDGDPDAQLFLDVRGIEWPRPERHSLRGLGGF